MAQLTKQARRVLAKLRELEDPMFNEFKSAIERAAANVDFGALVRAIDARDIDAIAELLKISPASLFGIDESVRSAFMSGGGLVPADVPAAIGGVFAFDGRHDRAEAWVRQNVGTLIQGIQDQSREATRRIIADGISRGTSSRNLARELVGQKIGKRRVGGVLGLNSDQADSLIRARSILSDPSRIREYFIKDRASGTWKPRYALSDRRFDGAIRRAIADGKPIKGAQLESIMEAHRTKALGYRGRVIAKAETFAALAAGREEGFKQVLDNPNVEKVTVRWQHNLSQNPREDHVAMDGTIIDLGDYFRFADALMKHPHDPAGGAGHSIGCRCIAIYRVVVAKPKPIEGLAPPPPPPAPTVSGLRPFTPAATHDEASQMAVDNNISRNRPEWDRSMTMAGVNDILRASMEVDDRFELPLLTALGSARWLARATDGKVKVMPKAGGWYAPRLDVLGLNPASTKQKTLDGYKYSERMRESVMRTRQQRIDALPDGLAKDAANRFTDFDYISLPLTPRRVALHEQGHRFHYSKGNFSEINTAIAGWRNWTQSLSGYGATNDHEFVAESFVIYVDAPDQHWRIMPELLEIFKDRDRTNVS